MNYKITNVPVLVVISPCVGLEVDAVKVKLVTKTVLGLILLD
jgi:hypothetical protein